MGISAQSRDRHTVESYLDMEAASPIRHEFVDGEIFAMTGASAAHNIICGNLFSLLHSQLRGMPCRVFMADMKLHIAAANSFFYPDLMVCCGKETHTHHREQPILVVEVLSETTAHYDLDAKRRTYQRISSLQEYLVISQECMDARLWRRNGNDWQAGIYTDSSHIVLQSVNLEIAIEQLYENAWS